MRLGFRAIHESINYGGNKMPEYLTCTHEIRRRHGVRLLQIAGKPLISLTARPACSTPAAVYNACAIACRSSSSATTRRRAPLAGGADLPLRAGHQRDQRATSDDLGRIAHYAQSFVRAYKIAMTPPYGPVAISLDGLQQEPIKNNGEKLYIPRYVAALRPRAIPAR